MQYAPGILAFVLGLVWTQVLSGMSFLHPYARDILANPVEGPVLVAGTFGELRANHFHSGLDIKGYIGKPLFAAAEGYVARIKVESGGYGKALYIDHPNGFTTVYAHMESFTPELEAWIKKEQYRRESFELDIRPEPGRFSFAAGQQIGEMGTTGYSFGPHLHFEVRRSSSQRPINPLFFGIEVKDELAPVLQDLKIYQLDERGNTLRESDLQLYKSSRGYRLATGDTVQLSSRSAGLAVRVFDQMNGAPNRNGIYRLQVRQDGRKVYQMEMESFAFGETRYINAHMDYAEKVFNRKNYYRTFILPGNRLSVYAPGDQSGMLALEPGRVHRIELEALDFAGNTARLLLFLTTDGSLIGSSSAPPPHVRVPMEQEWCKAEGRFSVCFPAGSFYSDLHIPFHRTRLDSISPYAPVYELGNPRKPVHRYYTVRIRPRNLPASKKDKAFIAYVGEDGELYSTGGKWRGEELVSVGRQFGRLTVQVDQEPPKIEALGFREDMSDKAFLRFRITDEQATTGRAKGLRYRATIDGRWALFSYDAKNSLLEHDLANSKFGAGPHTLRLEVWDDRDNRQVWEGNFSR